MEASFQNVTKQSQRVIPKARKSRENFSYIVILKKFSCKYHLYIKIAIIIISIT